MSKKINFFEPCLPTFVVPTASILFLMVRTRRFAPIFIWLWLIAVGSATSGIVLRQIYCYCLGETRLSLLANENCADQAQSNAQSSCCQRIAPTYYEEVHTLAETTEPQAARCCETLTAALPDATCASTGDCTHTIVSMARMDDAFLVEGVSVLKNLEIPCWLSDCPLFWQLTRTVICIVDDPKIQPIGEGPPAWEGRRRCIQHQLFRC